MRTPRLPRRGDRERGQALVEFALAAGADPSAQVGADVAPPAHGEIVIPAGDVLGQSGATGYTTYPQLHFAVFVLDEDGQPHTVPIRFAGDDNLFVSLVRLDLVQKYTGGAAAALDKLGGTSWEKAKTRVKKAMRDMAEELLKLYAQRKALPARERQILPTEPKVSGFVFKIQANMDPKHRDRIAFVRLASGHFTRGMRLTIPRTGKVQTCS